MTVEWVQEQVGVGVNYGSQFSTGPGASTTPFLEPGGHRAISQYWPGVQYPWMPWLPGFSGYSRPPPITPRICLGNQCFAYDRMALSDADGVVRALMEKSWPLANASLMAVALYEKGYRRQAHAILNAYGGQHGIDKVAAQIQHVYSAHGGPSFLPTGVPYPCDIACGAEQRAVQDGEKGSDP